MRDFHQKVLDLMAVDDFAPEDFGRSGTPDKPASVAPKASPAKAKRKTKKKAAGKKTVAKKTSKKKKKAS
jgi:hypothetical protein